MQVMNIQHAAYSILDKGLLTIGQLLRLFAVSAQTSGENRKLDNAARGGAMNFRRDELDDGTDPAGWYGDY